MTGRQRQCKGGTDSKEIWMCSIKPKGQGVSPAPGKGDPVPHTLLRALPEASVMWGHAMSRARLRSNTSQALGWGRGGNETLLL